MPLFEPPMTLSRPRVYANGPDRVRPVDALGQRLMGRFSPAPRGLSVLKINGSYVTVDVPTVDQIAASSEHYAGGHAHVVSDAVAAALTAAGYGAGISDFEPPETPEESTYQWDDLAALTYNEFASQFAWI